MNRPVATVERAVAVLTALAEAPGDLGTNEIARRTDVNPSTVSRLLATLSDAQLVRRLPDSGQFRLGPRLVELGNAALSRVDLRQLGRPHLIALTAATGETASLSIPSGESMITVDFVQSPSTVRSVAELGRPSVKHATAIGKLFLAHSGAMPTGRLIPYTAQTITDAKVLATEIGFIRECGWARAVGEREAELNALAAPVVAAGGLLVGALGLQGPAARFDRAAMDVAVDELVARAAQLSASHG